MSIEKLKAAALEELLSGPWSPDPTDSREPAVHLLKFEGVPVVSREVKRDGAIRMEHRMIVTAMTAAEIKAARQKGLVEAMRIHRRENERDWPALVKAIECPFQQDEAKQYLAGIVQRSRTIGH